MDKKKVFKDLISYGMQNEKNKQEIINNAAMIISVLNNTEAGKKISDEEMKKITGGTSPNVGDSCGGYCGCR